MALLGLFSDILLLAATLGMALYCRTLAGRLRAFNDLESGLGGAVAEAAAQVDDLKARLAETHDQSDTHAEALRTQIAAADDRIGRLELLMAGLEDIAADVEDRLDPIHPPEDVVMMPAFRATRPDSEGRFSR